MKIRFLAFVMTFAACSEKPAPPQQVQSLPVIAISKASATIYQEYPASIEGADNIEIRPQVSGLLDKVYVDDGEYVSSGAALFRIEQASFIQVLKNSRAALRTAEGSLKSSELEIEKLEPLVDARVVSDFQLKTARSAREIAMGNVERAKADIAGANISLGYTIIKAPMSGYISRIMRKRGSLIGPGDPVPLTELSDVHNVHVYFALGEHDFMRFKDQYPGNTIEEKIKKLPPVALIMANDSAYGSSGKIDLIDGLFDKNTGAIAVRATFPNKNGLLRSGNTGKIKLGLNFKDQTVVPQSATQEMQDKVFVFLVGKNNRVSKQLITVSGKSGNNYLVSKGLKPGDIIVYRGYDHLHEGDLIQPRRTTVEMNLASNN